MKILVKNNFLLNNSIIKTIIRFIFWNLYSILTLVIFVKKEKIDYIYSGTILNYVGVIVSLITKKKHIWHIHEMDNKGYQWINPKFNYIIKYFFKKSKLIFISEGVKDSWFKRLKLNSKEIDYEIIYNPIKELGYKNQNLCESDIRIGLAGSFCKNKNQKSLIETFIRLRKKYDRIYLKMAGENVIRGSQEIIKDRLPLESYFLYNYMEIKEFFNEIDILVVPSFSESWSLVGIEAASYGLIPVITTETSINEILKNNVNAIYINPFEKDELYNSLEELILNYEKTRELILSNNIDILKKYKLNKKFHEQIKNILN